MFERTASVALTPTHHQQQQHPWQVLQPRADEWTDSQTERRSMCPWCSSQPDRQQTHGRTDRRSIQNPSFPRLPCQRWTDRRSIQHQPIPRLPCQTADGRMDRQTERSAPVVSAASMPATDRQTDRGSAPVVSTASVPASGAASSCVCVAMSAASGARSSPRSSALTTFCRSFCRSVARSSCQDPEQCFQTARCRHSSDAGDFSAQQLPHALVHQQKTRLMVPEVHHNSKHMAGCHGCKFRLTGSSMLAVRRGPAPRGPGRTDRQTDRETNKQSCHWMQPWLDYADWHRCSAVQSTHTQARMH
jgi:hypothetical protein